jgi:gamma-glutamylaminecyclotransferase
MIQDTGLQDKRPRDFGDEVLVFVYGSMKRGGTEHAALAGSSYLGKVATEATFELIDMGGLPGLTTGGSVSVQGELYAVSERVLANLDELEDHPDTFHRSVLVLSDGREVLGYVLPPTQAVGFPRLSSGTWNEVLAG